MRAARASSRLVFLIGLLQADNVAAQEACNLGSMSATITTTLPSKSLTASHTNNCHTALARCVLK